MPIKFAALGLGLILACSVASVAAASPALAYTGHVVQLHGPAQQSVCTTMKATSDAFWLETDDSGDVSDQAVDSYPSGTTTIAAAFEYNCLPKGATIVTVFALDGEVVFSNKAPQKPESRAGVYSYTLSREDGAEIPEGEWEVGFFNNKTLLASGTITVGGDADQGLSDAIVVKGTIVDAKTKQPIRNALVVVLNEGIDAEAYLNDPQDGDVYTSATSDARGKFVLDQPIERSAEHTWIIAAKGYKPIVEDALVVGDDAEDPLELTITMTK